MASRALWAPARPRDGHSHGEIELSETGRPPSSTHAPQPFEALCEVLRALIDRLDTNDETHWRNWLGDSLAALEQKDPRAVLYLRGAYGGMSSFNDLIVGQRMDENRFSDAPHSAETNEELDRLRRQACLLAMEFDVRG